MKLRRRFPKFLKIAVRARQEDESEPPYAFPINTTTTKYINDGPFLFLLKKLLAFRFQLLEPADGQYGNILPDGNWSGLVGMVHRGEADLAIGELSITEARSSVVDFSVPYLHSSITFITDKPQYLPDKYAILHPFTLCVWTAVVASLSIVQSVSCIFEDRSKAQRHWFNVYATLLQQPVHFKLRKRATNILAAMWIVGVLFLALSYKNTLLSFLTFPSPKGARNIRELAKTSKEDSFKCSSYAGTTTYTQILKAGEESWRTIAECLIRSNMYTDDIESFLSPHSYKKAFIGNEFDLKSWHKNYFISEDTFYTDLLAIAVGKTFCCKKKLDETIYKIASFGILRKLEKDKEFFLALDKSHLKVKGQEASKKLSLKEFSTAFVILAIGLSSAAFAFLVEILFGRKNKELKNKLLFKRKLRHRSWTKSTHVPDSRRKRKLKIVHASSNSSRPVKKLCISVKNNKISDWSTK